MAAKTITWREFQSGGDVYLIAVRWYDKELNHVTADWRRQSDGQQGELGYGVGNSESAISLAERAILSERKAMSP